MAQLKFEWDLFNSTKLFNRHGIDPHEAESVLHDVDLIFRNSYAVTDQFPVIATGKAFNNKLLTVVFTQRHESIRIISARPSSAKERAEYWRFRGEALRSE